MIVQYFHQPFKAFLLPSTTMALNSCSQIQISFQFIFQPVFSGCSIAFDGMGRILRVKLLSIVCDAPAKAMVQNFTQFNGFYGCGICLSRGSRVKTSERGSMTAYPFDTSSEANLGHSKFRTHAETMMHAKCAEERNTTEFGVEGYTALSCIPEFDIISSMTVDFMHCVLLGVQKMLLNLWIGSQNKQKPYYTGDYVGVLDDRLMALCPPNVINRAPRPFRDLKDWKAS